ncbi:hypothetical protein SLA2020_025230 [Shorea laevis]
MTTVFLLGELTFNSSVKRSFLFLPFRPTLTIFSSLSFSSKCNAESIALPSLPFPIPKMVPHTVSVHGLTLEDPYHWMRDIDDPDFLDHLRKENFYAQAFMSDTKNLQHTLVSEMKSRMSTMVSTPPERWGPWLYYQYVPEGKEYPVLCRRLETRTSNWIKYLLCYSKGGFGREEILLDWNELAEKYGYVHVGTCRIAPDHNFLAYTVDGSGSEHFMLQIKDLRNGCIVPSASVDGVVSLAWAQDSKALFYTVSEEGQRPYRVFCKKLGSKYVDDEPIYTECDPSFCVDITSTKDGKFITVYIIDATNPMSGLRRIHKRVSGVRYFLEHHSEFFYVLTNASLSRHMDSFREGYLLARCRVEDIQSNNWQNIFYPGDDISLEDMDIFKRHLVLFLNKKGLRTICSIDMPIKVDCKHQMEIKDLNPWYFPVPSNSCSIIPGSNHDFVQSIYRMVISSPVMPDVIVDYDMSNRIFSIVQQDDVRGVSGAVGLCSPAYNGLDAHLCSKDIESNQSIELKRWKEFSSAYCCERKDVISLDGVRVPLTILYSRKAWKRGQSPGLLQGYGAYGEALDKSWCSHRMSLLDRGWVVAFADVRGGDGDSSWHKSGSGLFKQNSIYDFVSCGNYLIDEGYVHRDQLGAIGLSAGCLLVSAVINICPNLFHAAILKVPFLDMLNTLLDPSLPLTILDHEEFGNPQIKSEFKSILSYSPYENIPHGGCYPSVLVTASYNDSRVGVWEAAKWVAKVRDSTCSRCSRSVILKTNMSGGHFGEGGRYIQCEETAHDYAFLVKVMGANVNFK